MGCPNMYPCSSGWVAGWLPAPPSLAGTLPRSRAGIQARSPAAAAAAARARSVWRGAGCCRPGQHVTLQPWAGGRSLRRSVPGQLLPAPSKDPVRSWRQPAQGEPEPVPAAAESVAPPPPAAPAGGGMSRLAPGARRSSMAFGKSQKDPFGTAVGHLIERATVGTLPAEEWGLFMHICDIINTTEEGPKDAVKALKKRISKNCNHKEIRFTLSLLDMCMTNCGSSFRALVVKKDFCKDKLVKLLNPRYNLPTEMQEKILALIRTWAYEFQGIVDVSEVKEVYLELLKKGVQFPSSDANSGTQKRASSWPSEKPLPPSAASVKSIAVPHPPVPTITLTPEQTGKLYSELDMAKMNTKVMSAILKENVPGCENLDDMVLLQKLYKTCRAMQERIVELLLAVQNEDVVAELIRVNEELNNVLLGHERFSRNRVRFLENQRIQREHTEIYSKQPSAPSCDLLDINSSSSVPMSALVGNGPENPQFSELNCRSTSAADPSNHRPLLYPQLNLLATANAQQPSFATEPQSTSQNLPGGQTYQNLATVLNPVPLQTVNLQTVNASSQNETPPDISKSSSQAPHYYEVMEFDPLAPSYGTEAIYEEIDEYISKSEVKGQC